MGESNIRRKHIRLDTCIIHPSIEPGVIDNAMIMRSILQDGPKEEAGRLFAEEGVHMDEVVKIRLEFERILRIDHLCMLKSLTSLTLAHNVIEKIENLEMLVTLKELDLSFNKIDKIENLNALVNLEVLTLFNNKIRKIENMDALQKLIIFSIGDNLIEDYKEVTYLRQFRFLRTLSFKGNPCCEDPRTKWFLWAALPKVTFFDYILVTSEDRSEAQSLFRGLLQKLDEADEIKENERIAKEKYDAQVVFYAMSFVEYLHGPELFLSMFENDHSGTILLSFGGELITHYDIYKEKYVEAMAELVNWAQTAYTERENEIKLFRKLVEDALNESIESSKKVLADFEDIKTPMVLTLMETVRLFGTKQCTHEEAEGAIVDLSEEFNNHVHTLWKTLMLIEMQLSERCEEARVQFAVNLSDKITSLQEVARNAFGVWREQDGIWSVKQFEILSAYLGHTLPPSIEPRPELEIAMRDRDQMMNLIAASSDNHLRFIDAREDVLTTRSREWLENLVDGTTEREIQRNRNRIAEINYLIDNIRIEWQDLQMPLHDTVDAEAAALFGDEF